MSKPNILIILADGMQADAVERNHPCITPTLEVLSKRGVRFTNAHTTCPTCSPARASLMTGMLPHNHGVLEVEHGRDDDQCVLRTEHPHFAQRLSDAGYRTGYFGKWHVERTQDVRSFGWQEGIVKGAEHVKDIGRGEQGPKTFELDESLCGFVDGPRGYKRILHWGVTDTPLDERYPGITALDAEQFLANSFDRSAPWCCCVSFSEPNEALIVGRETWDQYDPTQIPLPVNFRDDMSDRPNMYQREQQIGQDISEDHWRAARACYFGRITELDSLVNRLLTQVEDAGQLDNTVVVFLADHGRYVGAHGFDAHNFGAFEEIYRIPLIVAGPGVAEDATCDAPVSIADIGVTVCDLGEAESIDVADSQSLRPLLSQAAVSLPRFENGYAEYHGTRFPLMQRILWQGPWKFVFNGFDFDELYNLDEDPHEMHNRARDPNQQQRVASMMAQVWARVRDTGDRAIHESHYFSMRFACVGPEAAK
ncbi:MAG: sulfatase-like hydrolase/transferase [Planctomycetes bacterium]|nr:sulfatase-like hydrolase/transferase [Planctomycetota bacterium]